MLKNITIKPINDVHKDVVGLDRVSAYVMEDSLLFSALTKINQPADWHIIDIPYAFDESHYGCALKKDDSKFQEIVDKAVVGIIKSPQGKKLYEKWFQQDKNVFGKTINLHYPITESMSNLFQ